MNLINPAFAGIQHDYSLTFNSINKWASIENSPSSQFFSLSSKREKNIGIGLSFLSNKAFIESITIGYLDFSYRLQLSSETNLFLGLKAGGIFFDANFNKLSLNNDPALKNYSRFDPNFGVGFLLQTKKFWVSFSVPRIFNPDGDEIFNTSSNSSNIYIGLGVDLKINDMIMFKPSLLSRSVSGYKTVTDFTTMFNVISKFEFGVNYRTNNSLSGLFLVNLNKFKVGYAYETSVTKSGYNLNLTSHEIFINIKINNGEKAIEVTEKIEE